jgi:hypothetical protein
MGKARRRSLIYKYLLNPYYESGEKALDSLSRKTTVQGSRRTSLRSDELRLDRRFRPENDKSFCKRQISWGSKGTSINL